MVNYKPCRLLLMLIITLLTPGVFLVDVAEANPTYFAQIPDGLKKDCALCHTSPPNLNNDGQRFAIGHSFDVFKVLQKTITMYSTATGGPAYSTTTDIDGDFSLPRIEAGSYTLVTSYPGYLAATQQVTVDAAATTEVGPLRLSAGDLDGNYRIGVHDLRLLTRAYDQNSTGATYKQADFNGDGRVDLHDLALLANNYNKSALPGTGLNYNLAQALAAGRLRSQDIIEGDLDGKLRPGATVTRAEFTVIAANLAGLKGEIAKYKNVPSQFTDVQDSAWYSYWIKAVVDHGIVKGYPDGTFMPGSGLTNAEVITVLLRLLGYNDNLPGNWPVDYLVKATELGLFTNLVFEANATAVRGNVLVMINNLLDLERVVYDDATGNFIPTGERLVESIYPM